MSSLEPAAPSSAKAAPAGAALVAEPAGKRLHQAGSLAYTRGLLMVVFLWLLWGEVYLTITEQIVSRLLPLSFKKLDASNSTIGLIIGLPCALNAIFLPVIGARSDRYRSRLGRRIPFLLVLAPAAALMLVLFGSSAYIGRIIDSDRAGAGLHSPLVAVFFVMAIAAVLFQSFDALTRNVYCYLIRDVIPDNFLGRFYGVARMVGAAAAFLFSRYGLGWADAHASLAFPVIGLAYSAGFLLICWRVKEGRYPPPPPRPERSDLVVGARTYLRECFSHPYYWLIYLGQAFYTMSSVCVHTFIIFFARDLGMSVDAFGKVVAWPLVLGLLLNVPYGYAADRIHPLRLQIIALAALPVVAAASFFAIQSPSSFLVWTLAWWLAHLAYMASNGPLLPRLLPAAKFGQFFSAMYILAFLGATAAAWGGGEFLDLVGDYRYIYVWNAAFNLVSLMLTLLIYRGWKRYGGPRAYSPPGAVSQV